MIMIHDACQGNLSYDYTGFSQKFDDKLKISLHVCNERKRVCIFRSHCKTTLAIINSLGNIPVEK